MPIIMEESEQVKNFYGVSFCTTAQHVDAKLSKVIRDNNDCKKFEDRFICHNPFPFGWLVSLMSTGVVEDKKINCHLPDRNGHSSLESIDGNN
ncbi:hypothetical protein AVEN_140524-1 [Araneus ventricosus]|uniref:Uncharacterized protein n=1 Tax=Araneus ventricosus TaxID=182803 RepID=A0A4Y2U7Z4_ARAVE|nr:hypothetical protein AVEN_140524-1 [Araneus ventricosus]